MNTSDRLAREALQPILKEVEGVMGFIPNSILAMARIPELVGGLMTMHKAVFGSASLLPAELKHMASYLASRAAGCEYCQAHTHNSLSGLGVAQEKIASLWGFENSAAFTEAERVALRVAVHAGMLPNAVTREDHQALKEFYSEDEIIELFGVICLFGYLNRWNDSMHTQLEDIPLAHAGKALVAEGWTPGKHHQ